MNKLPESIRTSTERAIKNATAEIIPHKTGRTLMATIEVAKLQYLLTCANMLESEYARGYKDGGRVSDDHWTNASGMSGFDKLRSNNE